MFGHLRLDGCGGGGGGGRGGTLADTVGAREPTHSSIPLGMYEFRLVSECT